MTDPSRSLPDAIRLRADMINGHFDLSEETVTYMNTVRAECSALVTRLIEARPATYDVGRFIACIDTIQHAKNLACDAAILGNEAANRKRTRPDAS